MRQGGCCGELDIVIQLLKYHSRHDKYFSLLSDQGYLIGATISREIDTMVDFGKLKEQKPIGRILGSDHTSDTDTLLVDEVNFR